MLVSRYLSKSGVRQVHELEDPAHELPVHGVVLVVGVEADPPAHRRTYDVDQPGQPALLDGQVHLAQARAVVAQCRDHLLVGLGRLVEQLHEQLAGLPVLTTADDGQLVQLLCHHTIVIQGIFQGVPKLTNRPK